MAGGQGTERSASDASIQSCRQSDQKAGRHELLLCGAAPVQVRAMAEAFSALPARVLWKLTPAEADALGNASLASNTKVCMHVFLLRERVVCALMKSCRA